MPLSSPLLLRVSPPEWHNDERFLKPEIAILYNFVVIMQRRYVRQMQSSTGFEHEADEMKWAEVLMTAEQRIQELEDELQELSERKSNAVEVLRGLMRELGQVRPDLEELD